MGEGGGQHAGYRLLVQHGKARPCSPWMPTSPTPACMLVPDRLCNRAECEGPPTDDTQHTEDMERSCCPPGSSCSSVAGVETYNYITITLLICLIMRSYTPQSFFFKSKMTFACRGPDLPIHRDMKQQFPRRKEINQTSLGTND